MNDEMTEPLKREPTLTYTLQIGTKQEISEQSNSDSETKTNYVTTDSEGIDILAEFFTIEIYTETVLEPQGIENFNNLFAAHINHLIKKLNEDIKLTAGIVEKICVVDESLLGEIIFQIQAEKGLKPEYTGQTNYYHTAAKTISSFDETGKVVNTIVININIYGAIMAAFAENRPYEEWETAQQFVYYILAHECGHAIDNTLRNDVSVDSNMTIDEYDLDKWSQHYAPLLFNEHIACRVSAKTVTAKLQKQMLEEWHDDSKKLIDNILKRKFSYDFHWREVMACFWLVLVQLGKLLGHHRDEADFPTIEFYDFFGEEEYLEEQKSIINDLDLLLKQLLKNYPQIPDDNSITESLTPIFERLAAVFNFHFGQTKFNSDDEEID